MMNMKKAKNMKAAINRNYMCPTGMIPVFFDVKVHK